MGKQEWQTSTQAHMHDFVAVRSILHDDKQSEEVEHKGDLSIKSWRSKKKKILQPEQWK